VARKGRVPLRSLRDELVRTHPSINDPDAAIARGAVVVDGRVVTNPASLVPVGAAITLRKDLPLRGEAKLEAALAAFDVAASGRTALDVGAAAGGFTRVLLNAGAQREYAVDAGHGQLLGSIRQDARVVNLERVNLAELNAASRSGRARLRRVRSRRLDGRRGDRVSGPGRPRREGVPSTRLARRGPAADSIVLAWPSSRRSGSRPRTLPRRSASTA